MYILYLYTVEPLLRGHPVERPTPLEIKATRQCKSEHLMF